MIEKIYEEWISILNRHSEIYNDLYKKYFEKFVYLKSESDKLLEQFRESSPFKKGDILLTDKCGYQVFDSANLRLERGQSSDESFIYFRTYIPRIDSQEYRILANNYQPNFDIIELNDYQKIKPLSNDNWQKFSFDLLELSLDTPLYHRILNIFFSLNAIIGKYVKNSKDLNQSIDYISIQKIKKKIQMIVGIKGTDYQMNVLCGKSYDVDIAISVRGILIGTFTVESYNMATPILNTLKY